MIIEKLKNCKLIISGDFNQLDVINDLQKYNYKDASILKELCDNNILKLTNCRRANSILFNLIQFENIPNLEKSVLVIRKQKFIFVGPMKKENQLMINI